MPSTRGLIRLAPRAQTRITDYEPPIKPPSNARLKGGAVAKIDGWDEVQGALGRRETSRMTQRYAAARGINRHWRSLLDLKHGVQGRQHNRYGPHPTKAFEYPLSIDPRRRIVKVGVACLFRNDLFFACFFSC